MAEANPVEAAAADEEMDQESESDSGDQPEDEGVVPQETQETQETQAQESQEKSQSEDDEEEDTQESRERIHICKKTTELGANAVRGKMNKWLLDWKFKQGEQDKEVTEG